MEHTSSWIPRLHLDSNLRAVKYSLKKLVKEEFEEPTKQKIFLQRDLATLKSIMDIEEVSTKHLKQEKEINIRILKATRQIEDEWRIKSSQMCLKGGERNIEYFHKKTKVR